jgi:Na+-translocating ferredoxin:NAD+ oxidoreductase subunit B
MEPLTISMIGMGGMAVVLASALGVADRFLRVESDPRVDDIDDILPSANCGGCGYPGCRAYAEAVVKGEVSPDKCAPGGSEVAADVAAVMGAEVGEIVKRIAIVHCQTVGNDRKLRGVYHGPESCAASEQLGGHTECVYGCLGLADCVRSCTFDALHMIQGLPVVDPDKCTACGQCVEACPRDIITLETLDPEHGVVYVACNSRDKGPAAKAVCDQSCIACGICKKKSEHGLFDVRDFLAVPLQEAISEYQEEADELIAKCPRSAIVREHAVIQIEKTDAA